MYSILDTVVIFCSHYPTYCFFYNVKLNQACNAEPLIKAELKDRITRLVIWVPNLGRIFAARCGFR
jgi:hypothetical protein